MNLFRAPAILLILTLFVSGCNRSNEAVTTTSSPPNVTVVTGETSTPSTVPPSSTTVGPSAPSTSVAPAEPIEFEIRYRAQTDNGDLLVALVPPADYDDLDLEGLLYEILDSYPTASDVRVIDNIDALQAVLSGDADLAEPDRQLRDAHYLVELSDGVRIVFHGPLSDFGSYSLGS